MNSNRLRKAASRTLRAEATLVIVILLITSYSVYGLYKLSIGASDSIFGFTFSKSSSASTARQAPVSSSPEQETTTTTNSSANNVAQSKPPVDGTHLDQIYQQLSAAQRDNDYATFKVANLINYANQSAPFYSRHHNQHLLNGIDPARFKLEASNRFLQLSEQQHQYPRTLPEGYENLLSFQREQRQQRATDPKQPMLLNKQQQQLPVAAAEQQPSLMQLNPVKYQQPVAVNEKEQSADLLNFNIDEDDYKDDSPSSSSSSSLPSPQPPDEDNDRVPAESSRDTTAESVVADPSSDEQSSSGEDSSSTETTTTEPEAAQEESATSNEEAADEQLPATTTEEPTPDDQGAVDDESLREAGYNIDEEVDRMTQPSSGSMQRQEQPPPVREYKNNAVQFDDLPLNVTIGSSVPLTGAAPQITSPIKATNRSIQSVVAVEPPISGEHSAARDLHQVNAAHSRLQLAAPSTSGSIISERYPKKRRKLPIEVRNRSPSQLTNRNKRSTGASRLLSDNTIKAPYEIGLFLDNLDFESLSSEQSSKRESRAIKPKNEQTNSDKRETLNVSETAAAADEPPAAVFDEDPATPQQVPQQPQSQHQNSTRTPTSSAFVTPFQGIQENPPHDDDELVDVNKNRTADSSDGFNRYQYLTSSDTGVQALFNKSNHLLSRYPSDELPPPIERPPPLHSNNQLDHQTAGSLYSVDHGLILYPEANEKHHEKTKAESKKHKKSEKMKHKKKMSIGVKKGGHKKKKHKKEMKKFIKEKKFKGAKKGKKVAKGKGGQGGKKGKKKYKDKGYKKKGFKKVYHKEEFGQKKSYFDEYRDKDFKKKWKKYDDKYNYARMKKWQAKDIKGAKKMKDHHEKYKKYDKSKWKKKYEKHMKEHSEKKSKKKKKSHSF